MQVENPIPFADPQTAKLTTGFLHAKYFQLLLVPWHLSADWSFACIPYIHSLSDPRNAATAALYAALLSVIIASRPWRALSCILNGSQPASTVSTPAQQADSILAVTDPPLLNSKSHASQCGAPTSAASSTHAEGKQEDRQRQAEWQMAIVVGLMIGPFLPAANIFFYVGTFIGERLLYLPSVGYCMMLSHYLTQLLDPGGLHSLHCIMLCLGIGQPASTAEALECGPAEPAVPAGPAGHLEHPLPKSATSRADSTTAVRRNARLPLSKSTCQDAQHDEQQRRRQQQQQQRQVQQCKPTVHSSKATGQSDASCDSRHVQGWIGLALVIVLLVGYSWRTVTRNRDWQDEETLFLAAQKVSSHVSSRCHFLVILSSHTALQQTLMSSMQQMACSYVSVACDFNQAGTRYLGTSHTEECKKQGFSLSLCRCSETVVDAFALFTFPLFPEHQYFAWKQSMFKVCICTCHCFTHVAEAEALGIWSIVRGKQGLGSLPISSRLGGSHTERPGLLTTEANHKPQCCVQVTCSNTVTPCYKRDQGMTSHSSTLS